MASPIPPLQPVQISLILHYIIPPSNLSVDPIPSHLISENLLQRHHFLAVSPDTSPGEYLSWKASPGIIEALEAHHSPEDASNYTVRYTHDGEYLNAHVAVDTIRITFQWDPKDSTWKYHDLGMMPFPSGSSMSPDEALSAHAEKSEDDYWNAYDESGPSNEESTTANRRELTVDPEDAYWEQYGAVHG